MRRAVEIRLKNLQIIKIGEIKKRLKALIGQENIHTTKRGKPPYGDIRILLTQLKIIDHRIRNGG